MGKTRRKADGIPDWVTRLDAVVWVVDAGGRMTFASPQACALFGIEDAAAPRDCHELVRGLDESGAPVCCERCDPRRAMVAGESVRPFLIRRADAGAAEWILVFAIPVRGPAGGSLLVHLAYPMSRYRRIQEYWEGVVDGGSLRHPSPREVLSPREVEVLTLLGRGEDLKRIARELFLSYTTVRNHVQHILEKLHVHSMQEAVGLHLLRDGEPDRPGPAREDGSRPAR